MSEAVPLVSEWDSTLLAASVKDRKAYLAVAASEEPKSFLEEAALAWGEVGAYYDRDPEAPSVEVGVLARLVEQRVVSPKKRKRAGEFVNGLPVDAVSPANVGELLRGAKRERVGRALAQALALRKPAADIGALIQEYQGVDEQAPSSEEGEPSNSVSSLLAKRGNRAEGLRISPKSLANAIGGLLPGHNLTVFARPEVGKSCFAINAAVGFSKAGVKVLYVGNEDPCDDMRLRALSSITGKPLEELVASPESAEEEARALGFDNLIFRDICPGTLQEVERMVREYSPAVLVVDQLRNLLGGKSDNFTQHLDRMAQGVRALGKRYGMVTISVTQAGDSARDKPVLDDGDIDSSNTGIPGAADVLIGIGATPQMLSAGVRNLALCKNKLTGKHDTIQVRFDTQLSRVRG